MFYKGKNTIAFVLIGAAALGGFACKEANTPANTATNAAVSGTATSAASSPTEAYKMLFAAVRAKDNAKIKGLMSKATVTLAGGAAKQFGHSLEKQLENGFLETTIADALPEIRDERVRDNYGAVEVYNQKVQKWDETHFVNEDGGWKLAVGDLFNGSYKSPGKSRSQTEAATNPSANKMIEIKPTSGAMPSANGKLPPNGNSGTVEVPVERPTKGGKPQ